MTHGSVLLNLLLHIDADSPPLSFSITGSLLGVACSCGGIYLLFIEGGFTIRTFRLIVRLLVGPFASFRGTIREGHFYSNVVYAGSARIAPLGVSYEVETDRSPVAVRCAPHSVLHLPRRGRMVRTRRSNQW